MVLLIGARRKGGWREPPSRARGIRDSSHVPTRKAADPPITMAGLRCVLLREGLVRAFGQRPKSGAYATHEAWLSCVCQTIILNRDLCR